METLTNTITEALRKKVKSSTLYGHNLHARDILLAEWLSRSDAPNWVRMIAGASDDAFVYTDLYAALIEEVKEQMEKDDDQLCSPPNQ